MKPLKTLSKEDCEFIIDMLKVSADKFYKGNKKVTASEAVLLATKELGISVTLEEMKSLTQHIKRCPICQ